ncbi:MAG TPA: hypothetical protein GXX72_05850 [Clostridiaceae bacterium]|jgi:putative transposase|nr:hypothetical protein [Clostridiaceae bacterium]
MKVNRLAHVWDGDIIYNCLRHGFMYLFVIIDRYIVDYELNTPMDRYCVLECLKRSFMFRKLGIINSDRDSKFPNKDYVELLQTEEIKISMEGTGACVGQYLRGAVLPTRNTGTLNRLDIDTPLIASSKHP